MANRIKNFIFLIILLASCENGSLPVESFMGLDQSYLIDVLGEPDGIEELVRNEEHVFGSIEDLWYNLKMGEKIVIWKYETHDGWREFYFLNNSTEVVGEFRWYTDFETNFVS